MSQIFLSIRLWKFIVGKFFFISPVIVLVIVNEIYFLEKKVLMILFFPNVSPRLSWKYFKFYFIDNKSIWKDLPVFNNYRDKLN